jgi:MtrB/PioB family decaheme-associated outer membrane protein
MVLATLAAQSVCAWSQAPNEDVRETVRQLITPDITSVTVGVDMINGERSIFSQYRDWREHDGALKLDLDFLRRDASTGTWTQLTALDLGLATRELVARVERQGKWKLYADYRGLVHNELRTINTGLANAGSTSPTVTRLASVSTGRDLNLSTERRMMTLGGEMRFSREWSLDVSLKNETREGSRLYGRGFPCPTALAPTPVCSALAAGASQWALLMLPEPIDSVTRQLEAKLNYAGDDLVFAAAYYGSFYRNEVGNLTPSINGNLNNPLGQPMSTGGGVALTDGLRSILQLPLALPPDNAAHQFSLTGNYAFSRETRATFRFAYTHATQNEDFAGMGLTDAPPGRTNLGGVLDTTLAQLGFTMRPTRDVTLLANVKYEDRQDKTPLDYYGLAGSARFTNGNFSLTTLRAKFDGTLRLPQGYRITLGADYESLDRGELTATDSNGGISGFRSETAETGLRAELRKPFADNFSASLIAVHSERNGGTWLRPNALPLTGTTPLSDEAIYSRTAVFPFLFLDRKRDKIKMLVDWAPHSLVSLQATLENGIDRFTAPSEKGLRDSGMRLASLDASVQLSPRARLSAWASYAEQTLHVSQATGYIANLKDRSHSAGLALNAEASTALRWGADLTWTRNRNRYDMGTDAQASTDNRAFLALSGGLPDVVYRNTRLKLFGDLTLDRRSRVRVELVHDRSRLDEWTWGYNGVPFVYSDNTTVGLKPNQRVTFVSATYAYRW